MTTLQHFSITKYLCRLNKLGTIEDFVKSKSYFVSVLAQYNRDINFIQQINSLLESDEPLDKIKYWISSNLVKSANLKDNQVYRFIQTEYLDKGIGINEPFSSFWEKYAKGKEAPFTKQAVSRFLAALDIKAKNKKCAKLSAYLNVSWQEISNTFKNSGLD